MTGCIGGDDISAPESTDTGSRGAGTDDILVETDSEQNGTDEGGDSNTEESGDTEATGDTEKPEDTEDTGENVGTGDTGDTEEQDETDTGDEEDTVTEEGTETEDTAGSGHDTDNTEDDTDSGTGSCETLPENCADCDCNTCEFHWKNDPRTEEEDCSVCPGGWDSDQDCAACRNHWEGPDCNVCPGNWDAAEKDCNECRNLWYGPGCQQCPDNADVDDCGGCRNHWEDGDTEDGVPACDLCPGNWDEGEDCGDCRNFWSGDDCEKCDPERFKGDDCDECANGWYDENQKCDKCDDQHWVWDKDNGTCSTCANGWQHTSDEVKDCGYCDPIRFKDSEGPDAQCKICKNGWEDGPLGPCSECGSHWEDDDRCDECANGWEGEDCEICDPIRFSDSETSCTICKNGWENDPTQGPCSRCNAHWEIGSDNRCDDCANGWEGEFCQECDEVRFVDADGPDARCSICKNGWIDADDGKCSDCAFNWAGEECDRCGQRWEASNCEVCANKWEGAPECESCPHRFQGGDWQGVDNCETCINHWVGDNCDVCPSNFVEGSDCKDCADGWEGSDCETCGEHFEEMGGNCNTCANNWEGPNCDFCPENWDGKKNCGECKPGWANGELVWNEEQQKWDRLNEDEYQCGVCVRYVDARSIADDPDGLTWENAFKRINPAIESAKNEVANNSDIENCEVWVAEGTYYAYKNAPTNTIRLQPGVILRGGFEGTEGLREDRDWEAHLVVLDGYRNGKNVYHVVTASEVSAIDGFVIKNGKANGESSSEKLGGGIYGNSINRFYVQNVVIRENQAAVAGGGAYLVSNSSNLGEAVILQNVVATDNTSEGNGGGLMLKNGNFALSSVDLAANFATGGTGGGVYSTSTSILMVDSRISLNSAQNGGGGFFEGGVMRGNRLIVSGNVSVAGKGAALFFARGADSVVANSIITANFSAVAGGADVGSLMSRTVFDYCTFESTAPDNRKTIFYSAGKLGMPRKITVKNSIVWRTQFTGSKIDAVWNADHKVLYYIEDNNGVVEFDNINIGVVGPAGGLVNPNFKILSSNYRASGSDYSDSDGMTRIETISGLPSQGDLSYTFIQQKFEGGAVLRSPIDRKDGTYVVIPGYLDVESNTAFEILDLRSHDASIVDQGKISDYSGTDILNQPRDEDPDLGAFEVE